MTATAAAIPASTGLFDVELADKTIILTPVTDLRELETTHLNRLWPILASREEALEAIGA